MRFILEAFPALYLFFELFLPLWKGKKLFPGTRLLIKIIRYLWPSKPIFVGSTKDRYENAVDRVWAAQKDLDAARLEKEAERLEREAELTRIGNAKKGDRYKS